MPEQFPNDPRLEQASQWLATLTAPALRCDTLRPASADASFRRYFRIDGADGDSYILMDAPPPQEDVTPFVHVAEVFGKTGVSVPRVLAQDAGRGFLLLTDLGATTYLKLLTGDTAPRALPRRDRRAGAAAGAEPARGAARIRRARCCCAS